MSDLLIIFLGEHLHKGLEQIGHNPLRMLDDNEIEKLLIGLIPLFHLDGNEVYKYQHEAIQECINIIDTISAVTNHNTEKEHKCVVRWFNRLLHRICK